MLASRAARKPGDRRDDAVAVGQEISRRASMGAETIGGVGVRRAARARRIGSDAGRHATLPAMRPRRRRSSRASRDADAADSVRAAEEADLLRRRAVGVGHEGRQRRHLLGVERLGLRAAHRPEPHGALGRAPSAARARRACAPARVRPPRWAIAAGDRPLSRRWRKVAGRRPKIVRGVVGDGRRVEDVEDHVVGEVALGQRLQRAALEHRAHRRAHALQARRDERVGQLALRASSRACAPAGPACGGRRATRRPRRGRCGSASYRRASS